MRTRTAIIGKDHFTPAANGKRRSRARAGAGAGAGARAGARARARARDQVRPASHRRPEYCLRRDLGFWRLRFAGEEAIFKDERGADYVAYLLLHPPEEPIHALDLVTRLRAPERKNGAIAEVVDPATGKIALLGAEARLQERGLALEDAQTMRLVLRTQNQLEALLEDEDVTEPVRREAERELIALYDYETNHSRKVRDNAQKAADAVGKAIKRFQGHLARAVEASRRPHRVLCGFAEHIRLHLLIPSGRSCARGGPRPGGGVAGCFTYEAPAGVIWRG